MKAPYARSSSGVAGESMPAAIKRVYIFSRSIRSMSFADARRYVDGPSSEAAKADSGIASRPSRLSGPLPRQGMETQIRLVGRLRHA